MTLGEATRIKQGTKVVFEGNVYDFGYIGQTGKVILYEEGERNMQDSCTVEPKLVELLPYSEGEALAVEYSIATTVVRTGRACRVRRPS